MALGQFLLTWAVMMAAMMLPAAASVGGRRPLGPPLGSPPLATAGFIAGYLADWAAAHAVSFLASGDAGFITGQRIIVDGGRSLGN
jgi:predicted metal-binding membrane protein